MPEDLGIGRLFWRVPDAVIVADAAGRVVLWNPAAEKLLGYAADEAVGRTVEELVVPPRLRAAHRAGLERYRRTGRGAVIDAGATVQVPAGRKGGDEIVAELTLGRLEMPGRGRFVLALVRDVTERERQLQEIRRLNADLARRAEELAAANRELEAFTYTISHDLRAPVRAVTGFARLLLEEHAAELTPEGRRRLGVVHDSAREMGQLVDDLLAFARLGRQPLRTEAIEPAAVARQALADLRHEREGRRVEVRVGDLPPCRADPRLLRRVYANLLSNALKFTRGTPAAAVEVGCAERGGEQVYFVRDNGTGFDMRYAGKLFGVFQRLHRASEYEGTGVGLAIVQRIVHRHGGRVWAEAAVGKGATFYFTLGEDGA